MSSDLSPLAGAAVGLDHIGIVGADLDALAQAFEDLGFHLTPRAAHAGGRTANRCAMLRDGGYLELMATVPGQSSTTLDRFLACGPGAHILALEVADEAAALARLRRAGVDAGEVSVTERRVDQVAPDGTSQGPLARFALVLPPDPPPGPPEEHGLGRVLLIRHLTPGLLWRPDAVTHPNGARALTEAVYATDSPARTMATLSRLAGVPAVPDPLGGYRLPLARGCVRVLPRAAAAALFPGAVGPPLLGLTLAGEGGGERVVHAGGVALRWSDPPP